MMCTFISGLSHQVKRLLWISPTMVVNIFWQSLIEDLLVCHMVTTIFFYEWGLPLEILTNNDTAFTCKHFKNFSSNWGVRLWFRCTYAPTGNDIIERSHWSIKTIVARKQCPIPETVYRENVMPKDNNSPTMALAVVLCRYHTWIWDVNTTSPAEPQDNWEAYELGKNSSWEVHD